MRIPSAGLFPKRLIYWESRLEAGRLVDGSVYRGTLS